MDMDRIKRMAHDSMAGRRSDYGREPGYVLDHGRRTALIALKLADTLADSGETTVDRDVLHTAALFHDIGKGHDYHNQVGAKMVSDLLGGLCTPDEIRQLSRLILEHPHRVKPNDYGLATRILQDADILDHVGAVGVWRKFYRKATSGGTIDHALRDYHSEEIVRHQRWMRGALNLDVSVDILEQRMAFERAFFEELARVQRAGL